MIAEPITRPRPESLAWLTSPDVVRYDGAVMSWVNPDHPGYPYPEIAGYMLSYLSLQGPTTLSMRNRIAAHIDRHDLTASGAVGRGGAEYVFDSAMVLAGLVAHQKAGGFLTAPDMPERLYRFISGRLERKIPLEGDLEADSRHWSQSYGVHLLKCVLSLTAYAELHQEPSPRELVSNLLTDLLPLYDNGRFRINADSNQTYMHAHCYALEGLLVLEGRGFGGLRPWIEGGASWLAEIQAPDGGLPALVANRFAVPTAHGDCTAQAVRIWSCVNPDSFRENIDRATRFLEELSAEGGIRYRRGSEDINTWVTIFGAQAFEMAEDGGSWQWLV
jgi:hypothetical protein